MKLTELVDYLFTRSGHYIAGDLAAFGLTLGRFWGTIKHDIKDYERFRPQVKRFNLTGLGAQTYDFTTDPNNTGFILLFGAPTITTVGIAQDATWSYVVAGYDRDDLPVCVSQVGTITTGNTTLTSSNSNVISWTCDTRAVSYKIFRVACGGTPTTLGVIGTVNSGNTFDITFTDIGQAGDGTTPPLPCNGEPPIFVTKLIPVGTMSVISVMAYGLSTFARNTASPSRLVDPIMFLWDYTKKDQAAYDDNTYKLYFTGWGSFECVANYHYLMVETKDTEGNLQEVLIQGLEDDYILLNLLYGKFLQMLGHMKRAFKYDDLPITVDGDELIREGRETYEAARKELYDRHKWWMSVRP